MSEDEGRPADEDDRTVVLDGGGIDIRVYRSMVADPPAGQDAGGRGWSRQPAPTPHAEVPVAHLDALLSLLLQRDDSPELVGELLRKINRKVSRGDRGNLYDELLGRVPRFLGHDDHHIAENAARTLRKCSYTIPRLPDFVEIVEDLAEQVHDERTGPAREAAQTLACLLSTRPPETPLPSWDGKPKPPTLGAPPPDRTWLKDLDQRRVGPARHIVEGAHTTSELVDELPSDTVATVVGRLRENLGRPKWKRSEGRDVETACCVAIALIGYQRPHVVEDAVDDLLDRWNAREGRLDVLLYTLTSIGYTAPELLPEEFLEELEAIASGEIEAGSRIQETARAGVSKIGHAPQVLARRGVEGDVDEAVDKLLRFTLTETGSSEEVVEAFRRIHDARPDALMDRLVEEIRQMAEGGWEVHRSDANLMFVVSELAEHDPASMEALLDASPDIVRAEGMHHGWYDWGATAIRQSLASAPDGAPDELWDALENRAGSEDRSNVTTTCERLLEKL